MGAELRMANSGVNDPLPVELAKINGDISYHIAYVDTLIGTVLQTNESFIDAVKSLCDTVETRNLILNAVFESTTSASKMPIDDFVQLYLNSTEESENDISLLFGLRQKIEDDANKSDDLDESIAAVWARTTDAYVRFNQAAYSMLETAQRHSQGLKPREFARGLDRILGSLDQD